MLNFFNSLQQFNLYSAQKQVQKINEIEDQFLLFSKEDIKNRINSLITIYQKTKKFDDIIIETFALTREASKRTLGLRHFDTQLLGGIILHEGNIAEMKTGEGKTLVATLPIVLNALSFRGVQVVTVNDYLAKRDKEWMAPLYNYLGLNVGLIQEGMTLNQKQKNYSQDITYVTNSELVFDYLKDNMASNSNEINMLRDFNFCIIDEVDSILIDEAITPLVISEQNEQITEKYIIANEIVKYLIYKIDYTLSVKEKNVILTSNGLKKIEKILKIKSLYSVEDPWIPYINNALIAKLFYKKNFDYIIEKKEILIVDQFTGRIMLDRRWSNGLHEAIEAKENIDIKDGVKTLASITYQHFFLLYPKISGMTGTAKTAAIEFEKIYNLKVIVIPVNKEIKRKDFPDLIYINNAYKWIAIIKKIKTLYQTGQPVLIGTVNIEKSMLLSQYLNFLGIKHRLLNAKPENVKFESEIIAQAGRKNAVTVATNMSGRGTDILLGGNPNFQIFQQIKIFLNQIKLFFFFKKLKLTLKKKIMKKKSKILSFLIFVIAKKIEIEKLFRKILYFYKRNKIDIYNLFYVSNSLKFYKIEIIENIIQNLNKNTKKNFLNPLELYLINLTEYFFEKNQKNFSVEKDFVKNLNGLYVIGTERQESKRIDNQLRGRAGRQGDPGISQIYSSLDDDSFRRFGTNTLFLKKKFEDLKIEMNEGISDSLLDDLFDSTQTKIENFNTESRKNLFDYEQIINLHRIYIYNERKDIINSKNLKNEILLYGEDLLLEYIQFLNHLTTKKTVINKRKFYQIFKEIECFLNLKIFDLNYKKQEIFDFQKLENILYNNLWITYTFKNQVLNLNNSNSIISLEKNIILYLIDKFWIEHLKNCNAIKETISWRSYAQFDPLVEYQKESLRLFIVLIKDIRYNSIFEILQYEL